MAVGYTQLLTVLSILQVAVRVGHQDDASLEDLRQQQRQQEWWEMHWLQEEMEDWGWDPHDLPQQGTLLAACQRWWFWACADALLMLFGIYWLPRQGSAELHNESSTEEEMGHDWEPDLHSIPDQDESLDEVGTSVAFARPFLRTDSLMGLHPAYKDKIISYPKTTHWALLPPELCTWETCRHGA